MVDLKEWEEFFTGKKVKYGRINKEIKKPERGAYRARGRGMTLKRRGE
jgi:hypothetical protein